jgi:hypothetical protein
MHVVSLLSGMLHFKYKFLERPQVAECHENVSLQNDMLIILNLLLHRFLRCCINCRVYLGNRILFMVLIHLFILLATVIPNLFYFGPRVFRIFLSILIDHSHDQIINIFRFRETTFLHYWPRQHISTCSIISPTLICQTYSVHIFLRTFRWHRIPTNNIIQEKCYFLMIRCSRQSKHVWF